MAGVPENRFARATTMIANGADELRSRIGKARASEGRIRAEHPVPPDGALDPSGPVTDEHLRVLP
ncbi:MAG: hypothetical protein ACE14W_11920 [Candidatus Velamenicoccus archaeovorus]